MIKNKFKSGAASFYVVAFSTLILVIIAASFASAIIAEVTRTSNSDLAQSAYDAALAGIEDAKAAFINYQNCLAAGGESAKAKKPNGDGVVTCSEIVYWMEHAQEENYDDDDTVNGNKINDCDMVGHILGRINEGGTGEVMIDETEGAGGDTNNNMQQAYTCVIIKTKMNEYRADLNAITPYRIIKVQLEDGISMNSIGAVRVSWYSNRESDAAFAYNNIMNNSQVAFQSLNTTDPAVPPTIGVEMIQTASSFSLGELNGKTNGEGQTDRAMVYLVPTDNADLAATNTSLGDVQNESTFVGAYNGTNNVILKTEVASTNDHSKDYPFVVYCPSTSADAYACSAVINLPEPINGVRSNETFMFVISLPYGQPSTDFALELICDSGSSCGELDASGNPVGDAVAKLDKMQVMIDSTGRANDLFRRLEIRLDPGESSFGYPLYAVQVDDDFSKALKVTQEKGNYSGYNNW